MIDRYQQFSYIVSVINRQIQKIERDEMEKYGYKGAFAQYLMAMRRNPAGVTSAQLSDMCDRDKAAVSRVITEMIEKGLVVRKSANETFYRAKLTLTQKGAEIADYIARQGAAAVAAVNNELTKEELKAFYSNLDYIADKLHIISKDGIPNE
ncbi:MAG: MarR family transcriptional regulator [Oscillospiraceae bacterium]|nr:MarR family transcriptional regulator [Oscillospiraceae bacterium]